MAVAVVLAGLSAAPAHADGFPRAFPRGAVVIGGTSVVLVATNDKIYVLVDRLEDNTPDSDAAVSVDMADGSSLNLSRVSDGLFVAPFNRAGRLQDAFLISLASPDGSGNGAAEIGYDDMPGPDLPSAGFEMNANATIAAMLGAMSAIVAGSVMLLSRTRRRRAAASLVGSGVARSYGPLFWNRR